MNTALLHLARLILMCCWPAVAWAGTLTLGQTMGQVGWRDVAAVLFLSAFSGAVAMLQRMEREAAPAVPWRWITAHMSVAVLAGLIAFLLSEIVDLPDWQEALGIIVAAWGGASYIERIAQMLNRSEPVK